MAQRGQLPLRLVALEQKVVAGGSEPVLRAVGVVERAVGGADRVVVLAPAVAAGRLLDRLDPGARLVGAIWLLHLLDYNTSIAVWVGLIALMGVDAETGVFMLLYLDLAYEERRAKGLMRTKDDLREAIVHGAVKRLRPKFMTVAVMFMGLVPIMWSTGAGADVMKRIAAPMIGGIFTSFIMELVVYPAIYEVWRWYFHVRKEAKLV